MATPASGTISMNNMNTEILRAGGTATVDMNTIRTRFGGSGAISFSDLHDCEGFTVTCGEFNTKFGTSTGFHDGIYGSVSPDEGDGRVQFAANCWIYTISSGTGNPGIAGCELSQTSTTDTMNGDAVTAGYRATDVTRIVTANVSRGGIFGLSNSTFSNFIFDYTMPGSGTIHCLIKF